MRVLLPFPVVVPLAVRRAHRDRLPITRRRSGPSPSSASTASRRRRRRHPRRRRARRTQSVTLGGWPAPVGITLVADLFSALMLVIGLITVLAVLVFAIGQPAATTTQPASTRRTW